MHPSLFKALSSISYWPWVVYPMGKCTLILKGCAIWSAILAATIYPVPYCAVSLCRNAFYYLGCMRKLITFQ